LYKADWLCRIAAGTNVDLFANHLPTH
jgi:hypothetical protein